MPTNQKRLKVGIICGGPSSEREVSLRSGAEVFRYLDRKKFIPSLIEISRSGKCTIRKTELRGTRKPKSFGIPPHGNLDELKHYANVIFIALHGTFGEDGRIQAILETIDLPYTGSGVLASALAMDKEKAQVFLGKYGITSPKTIHLKREDITASRIEKLPIPCVVKPNASGSSVGVQIVTVRKNLIPALHRAFQEDSTILIQQYIKGREVTCGVLGNAENPKDIIALPPVEIVADGRFFDYHAKYHSNKTKEICPAPMDARLTKKIQNLSVRAHQLLGCQCLTRSDFIVHERTPIFLELNTLPGLTAQSLCPKEARAAGMSMTEFLTRQIKLAYK